MRTARLWAMVLLPLAIGVWSPWRTAVVASTGGSIEGIVDAPVAQPGRTADRYTTAAGEARMAQSVPVVVYIEGAMPGASAARPSGPLELEQKGQSFRPTLLIVPLGAAVTFPNGDPLFHNVFSYSRPKRFDLGRYRQGESKTVVFDKPGYVKVMCEVHKWMRSAVLVAENPFYAVADANGRYRIDGVPPGHYKVAAEFFERRAVLEVDVTAGSTARLDFHP